MPHDIICIEKMSSPQRSRTVSDEGVMRWRARAVLQQSWRWFGRQRGTQQPTPTNASRTGPAGNPSRADGSLNTTNVTLHLIDLQMRTEGVDASSHPGRARSAVGAIHADRSVADAPGSQLGQGAPEQQSSSVTGPRQPVNGGLANLCPLRTNDSTRRQLIPLPIHEGMHATLTPCSTPEPAQ